MKDNLLDPEGNAVMFHCGFLDYKKKVKDNKEEYIEGTFCVSIIRDIVGLPLIFIGQFLPIIFPSSTN